MSKKLEYGVADRAWHPLVGCDPHMSCAPRCWARKTTTRTAECMSAQHPERAEFFRQALSPYLKRWSGKVLLDENHLYDPISWRKPAIVASGFHGDFGRLSDKDRDRMFGVMLGCKKQSFLTLTKQPQEVAQWAAQFRPDGQGWITRGGVPADSEALISSGVGGWPPQNVSIGCSVMNQSEADKMREPMAKLAAMGWHTHCWYEPALGPVDWGGWEFLGGIVAGGESGPGSRPAHPDWFRRTRDWCVKNGVPFTFKQAGDWEVAAGGGLILPGELWLDEAGKTSYPSSLSVGDNAYCIRRVGKRAAGRLLDGREWQEFPARWVGTVKA